MAGASRLCRGQCGVQSKAVPWFCAFTCWVCVKYLIWKSAQAWLFSENLLRRCEQNCHAPYENRLQLYILDCCFLKQVGLISCSKLPCALWEPFAVIYFGLLFFEVGGIDLLFWNATNVKPQEQLVSVRKNRLLQGEIVPEKVPPLRELAAEARPHEALRPHRFVFHCKPPTSCLGPPVAPFFFWGGRVPLLK